MKLKISFLIFTVFLGALAAGIFFVMETFGNCKYLALGMKKVVFFMAGQNFGSSAQTTGRCQHPKDCFGSSAADCQNEKICMQKSITKCKEYGKYVYKEIFSGALTARSLSLNITECSIDVTPLIVGGFIAKSKEFPHMAAIGYGKDIKKALWLCGGSLISENFVLSAAHCSLNEKKEPAKFVRMGTLKAGNPDDTSHQDYSIEEIYNHPEYKSPSYYNDIALYKLSESVKINEFVRPACLHVSPDEFTVKQIIATGWGKTDYHETKGSEVLRKVFLSFIDYSVCNNSFSAETGGRFLQKGIINSQLCAGELKGGKDTCQGDSGGPLQLIRNDPYCMYSIIGITSAGKFCGFKNSPAIYSRVSYYIPWIESIVWP